MPRITATNKLPASMTNPAAAPFSDFADELLGAAAEAEELPLDSRGNEEVEVSEASDD